MVDTCIKIYNILIIFIPLINIFYKGELNLLVINSTVLCIYYNNYIIFQCYLRNIIYFMQYYSNVPTLPLFQVF